ncbi:MULTISPECIES: hemerythrin domain-containing protein [Thauera]|uniref:hemerythrin domain-containing protein n=1 Tax=Thauera TaxID=33057 RepID=UPI0009EDF2BA|nr:MULTISPECIES: hemerythrin domain-containing protein [Thauera]
MKRHPRLVKLSREHHTALRLGRHLLTGDARVELSAELPAIEAHFAEEERDLLPLLEGDRHGTYAERLRAEHAQLRRLLAAAVRGTNQAQAGQALIDHVRFEERELFPVLETLLD